MYFLQTLWTPGRQVRQAHSLWFAGYQARLCSFKPPLVAVCIG